MKKLYLIACINLLLMQEMHTSDAQSSTGSIIGATTALGALSYAAYLHLTQPEPAIIPDASTSDIKSIIFDLDGVLCTTNKLRAFQEIGIGSTLWPIATNLQLPSEKLLFDTLAQVPAVSTQISYNKGRRMPQIMIDWQTNVQTIPAIRTAVKDYLTSSSMPESIKNLMIQTIRMMTEPRSFVATRQTISTNVKLLHELKTKGYKLYILSNWDAASFPLFKATFPEIFTYHDKEMFDGIMISGNVGIVKPELDIFKKCLDTSHLQAENTLFIDDEAANIISAQQMNMTTVHCNPHDSLGLRNNVIAQLTLQK